MEYVRRAIEYAEGVVAGTIPACKWTRLACQRQLDDLERWHTDDAPYRFDVERAEHICRFIELLPHIKGEWARKRLKLKLEPWQIFILTTVFGWVKTEDDCRRFRTVYIEVPRKNAKSTKSSGVALYMVSADGEAGAEVYSAATSRQQAGIVFVDAQRMARREKGFQDRYGVEVQAHAITVEREAARFIALAAEDSTLDGLNPHCAIIDELHAHKTRGVWDVIESATGSRSQSLIWAITTAGSNRAGICYEQRTYVTKILDRVPGCVDDSYFGIIYTIDDGDAWDDPAAWAKANPNLGVSVKLDQLTRLAAKARQTPSAKNNFLTKHLNVWVNADQAWMDMQAWDRCTDPRLSIDEFEGEPCWLGTDLASKRDLAAIAKVFTKTIERRGKPELHVYAFTRAFLPEEAAEESDNSQYSGWAEEGRLVLTPGNVLDFEYVKDEIRECAERFDLREVGFDPWQATQMASELLEEKIPMVEVRPNVANFSEPMKQLEALVLSKRFHHDGDPILAWCVSNVVAHYDKKDNIYPNKERPENKIDLAVALITALSRVLRLEASKPKRSVYETRGLL